MPTVVLVGTLDTKGPDYDFVRTRLRALGCEVVLVDAGVLGQPTLHVEISREDVARAAEVELADLVARNDRGFALEAMVRGVTAVVRRLFEDGHLHGVLGLGGSGGTSLITPAMRALPIGVPKLMVSTVASAELASYVGAVDICMMYSVIVHGVVARKGQHRRLRRDILRPLRGRPFAAAASTTAGEASGWCRS